MGTARDLIRRSLLDLGVIASGESMTADEAADGLYRANLLLEQWRLQSLLVYAVDTVTLNLTGASSYTWGIAPTGPPADIPLPRPVRLEHGVQRIPGAGQPNLDFPLEALNDADFEMIGLKDLQSGIAYYFYLDRQYPVANLRFYPVLPAGYQAILYPWHVLSSFVTLEDTVAFPPGYELALQTNLSLHLVASYRDCQVNPITAQQAMEGVHWLKIANQRPRHLLMPAGMPGPSRRTGTDRAGMLSGWAR